MRRAILLFIIFYFCGSIFCLEVFCLGVKDGVSDNINHVVYKDNAGYINICSIVPGWPRPDKKYSDEYKNIKMLSHCRTIKKFHDPVYAVSDNKNSSDIYIYDNRTHGYQNCLIRGNDITDCRPSLIADFKPNKLVVYRSKLYILGKFITSCHIDKNNQAEKCINIDAKNLDIKYIDTKYSESNYSNMQFITGHGIQKVILTKKTSVSVQSRLCQLNNNNITDCIDMKSGYGYKIDPDNSNYIYETNPLSKVTTLCRFNIFTGILSECTSVINSTVTTTIDNNDTSFCRQKNFNEYGVGSPFLFMDFENHSLISCRQKTCDNYSDKCNAAVKASTLLSNNPIIRLSSHSTSDGIHKEAEQIKEKGNDSLIISGENGNMATCSLLDDKKFHCNQYDKINQQKLYSGFIRDYSLIDTKAMQYAYFINDSGSLTECQFNIKKINDKPDIGNCNIRSDIKLPVKIKYGKVLSTVNSLLLISEDSEIFQCGYSLENKITGCYSIGMKDIAATEAIFDSLHNKVYLYSGDSNKLYSCNFINGGGSIENCLPVKLNTNFPDKNIQHVIMSPDSSHILLAENSSLHYCDINDGKLALNNCMTIYDKFYNVTSLAYSQNNDKVLYIVDNKMIKSCYLDDLEMRCHKMELNNNIQEISVNKLLSTTIFTYIPIKITNKGGYYLQIFYTTLFNSDRKINIRKQKELTIADSENLLVKGGSGIELHAESGNTKCFIVNQPGEIHCNRGTLNMACYYNGSSKKIINKSCPFSSYKNACTPDVLKYARTSGTAGQTCRNWKMNYKENYITVDCRKPNFSFIHNIISCYPIQLAMKLHKQLVNKNGKIVIEEQDYTKNIFQPKLTENSCVQ